MALSSEIDHGAGLVLGQQLLDQGAVANVALHKDVAWIVLHRGQGLQIARVGEFVEVEHGLIAAGDPVDYEIAADEPGAASNENSHVSVKRRSL
jgi:hypothetical protein